MKRLILILAMITVLIVACTPSEPTPEPTPTPAPTPTPLPVPGAGKLYVDPQVDLGSISPYVYGTNHGIWTAVPLDMMPVALDAGITVLRWPGGAWGDRNQIQKFQVDQFIDFCEQMGAIPTRRARSTPIRFT